MQVELTKNAFIVEDVVKLHSKYASEDLALDALLEEELGLDSIMLASILADLNGMFEQKAPVSLHAVTTMRELYKAFEPALLKASAPKKYQTDSPVALVKESDHQEDDAVQSSTEQKTLRDFVTGNGKDLFGKVRNFNDFYRQKKDEGLMWYGMASQGRSANRSKIFDEYEGREREFLMFASNNYLGLANDERVIEAICNGFKSHGATNTGCRIIGGTTRVHLELEERLAAFKQREACIVFPSGYSANVGTISALLGPKDVVVTDVYNHMSIQDGCKMSGAKKRIFKHNDMNSLEDVLRKASEEDGGILIAVDGVYSMHGDIVNLPALNKLAKKYQARVLVDDAHSTGVLGQRGSGTTEHFGLKDQIEIELGTMSKALAGMGGFVVGDKDLIEYLRFYANSYVFAATIPAGVAAGLVKCIDILEQEPERVERVRSNAKYLKDALDEIGFNTEASESAIVPVVFGDETTTMAIGRLVRKRGMFCQTVVFPGVAVGDARLRISVLAEHTKADLDEAISILIDSARELGLEGF